MKKFLTTQKLINGWEPIHFLALRTRSNSGNVFAGNHEEIAELPPILNYK